MFKVTLKQDTVMFLLLMEGRLLRLYFFKKIALKTEKQCITLPYFRNKDCCRQNFLLAQLLTFRAQQGTEENLYWHTKIQLPLWEESCCLTVGTVGWTPSPNADSLILAGETAGHHE